MSVTPEQESTGCPICGSSANIRYEGISSVVHCSRCGDFWIDICSSEKWKHTKEPKKVALASHLIRKMQASAGLAIADQNFFASLKSHLLPTPTETMDTLLLWCAQQVDKRPGASVEIDIGSPAMLSEVGVVADEDLEWVVRSVVSMEWLGGRFYNTDHLFFTGKLSIAGWERAAELQRAKIASNYAFFARKFDNAELDRVYDECLSPAVKSTGFELRTASQKAGPVDAIIEDEIRRCRFLIADLSDDNLGAYWEAGFAEGLGKPVIYICRDKEKESGEPKRTHFDTDHRHTVRWNLNTLDETAKRLKAVIRNTLLGDAVQSDQ